MSRLTQRGFTTEEAADFRRRASGPHTAKWRASSFRWLDGDRVTLYEDLPISGGTLALDASDPTRRRLTLEVAGVGDLVPDTPNDPLACFDAFIKLWMTIDRQDGSWFDWVKMGEYPIQTTSSEWPSMLQTVECGDWSVLIEEYLHVHKKSYSHLTVANALRQITEAALPNKVFAVEAVDDAQTTQVEPHTIAEAASSRWETAISIANARGFETFFDWDGDLVIRNAITSADNDTAPDVGPDTGTISNPVATIRDGERGNLIALTQTVTREGGANACFITLHETASQSLRQEGRPVAGDKRVNVTVEALGVGAIAWGDRYGRQPIVIEKPVKVITDDVVARQQRRANRILARRGGVISSIDLDAVGLYWCEPDDRVRIEYDGRQQSHYIASIEFDLSGKSPTRIRTRSLTINDPDGGDD